MSYLYPLKIEVTSCSTCPFFTERNVCERLNRVLTTHEYLADICPPCCPLGARDVVVQMHPKMKEVRRSEGQ